MATERTRLLWHSNAPWAPTGYGQQTALFAPLLAEHYEMSMSSFYGLEGAPRGWKGIPILPGLGGGDYGSVSVGAHARRMFGGDPRGGIVVTLMDVWVLDPAAMSELNAACWVPVDHDPAPPAVVEFFLKSGAVPIAMSRFGERMLGRLDPLYVPHAVDTTVYKPHDKQKARNGAFPDDAFIVGMVAANKGRPSRKSFVQAFQAFRMLLEKHENAFLYLHTMLDSNLAQGENLPALLRSLEIPDDRVRIADQYAITFEPHTHEEMARIYSAMDVLLNCAMGEGFGIPVLEAQACGTPAIVTDFSAMQEVCGAGWHVKGVPYWTGQNSWMVTPDVDDIASALEECFTAKPRDRALLAQTARKHALNYDLQKVFKQHMLPGLRVAQQRFEDRNPVTISPRLKAAA